MGTVILAFIVLVGPLSYFLGVDSRRIEDRGWFAAPRREREARPAAARLAAPFYPSHDARCGRADRRTPSQTAMAANRFSKRCA